MTEKNKKIELKRVNFNLPVSLVKRVEDYAYSMGLNVTNAYIVLLNQALDQKATINNLPNLLDMVKLLFDNKDEYVKNKQNNS